MIVQEELAGGIDDIMVCYRLNQIKSFSLDINIMKLYLLNALGRFYKLKWVPLLRLGKENVQSVYLIFESLKYFWL